MEPHSYLAIEKPSTPLGLMVRYERSFLVDLQGLEPALRKQVIQFVFDDFYDIHHLQELQSFRPLSAGNIFYRFTFSDCLVCVEITGQILKFLRILPKPSL